MKNKVKAFFTRNIGLKIGSLFLGILIWAVLSNTYDPITTKDLKIPVTYLNEDRLVSEESLFVLSAPETVQITVSVRTSKKAKATADLFTCTADLLDHNGGDNASQRVHVSVSQVSGSDIVLDWNYSKNDPNITVEMDDYIRKNFAVQLLAENSLTEGLILENSISFDPAIVTVSGPSSKFSSLSSVKAVVNLDELSEGGGGYFVKEIDLQLYDANDNPLNNTDGMLVLDHTYTTMQATVSRIQTVSVIVSGTVGTPQYGYRYVSSSAEPSVISVQGLKSTVADLTELDIPAEYIDISGISADTTYQVDITPLLPDGVSLAEGDGIITVSIFVEQLQSSTFSVPVSDIRISGKKSSLEYDISESAVTVTVKGFKEDLELLTADSLVLSADFSNYKEMGTYQVPVKIQEISGYTIVNPGDVTLTLKVTEIPASSDEEGSDTEEESGTKKDTDASKENESSGENESDIPEETQASGDETGEEEKGESDGHEQDND